MVELDERGLYARDVYAEWRRRVSRATFSIRVFTPYLDRMLDRLLQNSSLEPESISVVTDLSPTSGALDYRGQLLGIRALLKRGVSVRSLPRLHAKVLVCDEHLATIGSQNFTSYGRQSKETTVAVSNVETGSQLSLTLAEWWAAAVPVDLELIEELLLNLDETMKRLADARSDLTSEFDASWESYALRLAIARQLAIGRDSLPKLLARAVERSTQRQARPLVWASLQSVGDWDPYDSLVADRDSSLTRWMTRTPAGERSFTILKRLQMYPILLNPSGRMAFGRVADTRVTYIRKAVNWTTSRRILGQLYRVRVRFADELKSPHNLEMTLSHPGSPGMASLTLFILFTGESSSLVRLDVNTNPHQRLSDSGAREGDLQRLATQLEDPPTLDRIVSNALSTFKYSELGIGNRNASDFFPPGWVRVTIIDYLDKPILIVNSG